MVSRRKSIFDDCHDRKGLSFPDSVPMILSHSELPGSYQAMEDSGEEYGFTITPFIKNDSHVYDPEARRHFEVAGRVARCTNGNCTGYMNPFCDTTNARWFCSMCGYKNTIGKSQHRYRHIDLKLLPELQDPLVDYRAPLQTPLQAGQRQTQSQQDNAIYSVPVTQRPLLHVFLVQESMQLDALQSTVEALTAALTDLHPEVQIILLIFSHRIGIYRFKKGSLVPSVQYVHFLAMPTSAATQSLAVEGIFEGHNLQELDPQYRIEVSMPLGAVVDLRDAACAVGDCREALLTAVNSLFDAFSNDSCSSFGAADEHLPKMMLGPTIEAVHAWLSIDPSDTYSDYTANPEYATLNPTTASSGPHATTYTDADHFRAIPGAAPTGPAELTSLFANLTLGLWNSVVGGAGAGGSSGGAVNSNSAGYNEGKGPVVPAEAFTGIVMHYFIDSQQDLRYGSHDSVAPPLVSSTGGPLPVQLDTVWIAEQTALLCKLPISVNCYSIVNFDSREVGLSALQALCSPTGGRVHRAVLGHHPAQERARLAEVLRRAVTCLRATRGMLKLRGSQHLDFLPDLATGGLIKDDILPGVFRVSTCTPETTFAMQFQYNPSLIRATQATEYVIFQMAFSYETVVESKDLLEVPQEESTLASQHSNKSLASVASDGVGVSEGFQQVQGQGQEEEDPNESVELYTDSSAEELSDEEQRTRHRQSDHAASQRTASGGGGGSAKQEPSSGNSGNSHRNSKRNCGMETQPNGYFEHSVDQLQLGPLQQQIAKYYHVADATVQSRRQTTQLEYPGMARGFLLSQQPNRPSALNHRHKLIVVKYLRIYTTVVPTAEKVLSVQLQANAQMYASLLMRRALRLERDYRLSHRYSSVSATNSRSGSNNTEYSEGVIGAFMNRIPVDSPGIALMINSLIKHIIKVSHYYAAEKTKPRTDNADFTNIKNRRPSAPTPSASGHVSPPSKDLLENVVNDVFTYPAIKDLLIYTFACIDKLTFYHPIVGQKTDLLGVGTGEYAPYVCDDSCVFESIVESVDSAQLSKLLHPLLVPVSSELKLNAEFLPLTRRSLVMSDQKYFFLDAGTDFVLYRAVTHPGAGGSGGSGAGSASGPFAHMLEVVKLDGDFAESCIHAAAQARHDYPAPSSAATSIPGVESEGDFAIGESAKSRTKSTRGQPRNRVSDCVAPKVVNHMYDGDFLLLYLARRLKNATVLPRVQVCDAGTGSASVFDAYLLEDHSRSGLSYHQFVEYLIEIVKRDMKLEP